jgi:hypothetical protein
MQLCSVKHRKENIFSLVAKRLVVFLMLLLFAGAPVINMLHTHHDEHVTNTHHGDSVSEFHLKCEICDHFTQHQPTPLLDIATLSLIYFEGNVAVINGQVNQKLLSLSGLGWSNKGPPSLV